MFTINIIYVEPLAVKIEVPEDGNPDISVTRHLLDRHYHSSAWNNFRRSLTAAQYHNPNKAVAKFCNYMPYQEWKKFTKKLLEHALSNNTIEDGSLCIIF